MRIEAGLNSKSITEVQSYTYPQFVINEKTGRIAVNFVDRSSGRVLRHIPPGELLKIMHDNGSFLRL